MRKIWCVAKFCVAAAKIGVFTVCFGGFLGACYAQKSADIEKLRTVTAIFSELNIPLPALNTQNIENFLAELDEVLAADTDNLLLLADKKHFLPADYEPADLVTLSTNSAYTVNKNGMKLRAPAQEALFRMGEAAKKDGVTLLASSAYRSYEYQKGVYERNVKQLGKEAADRESAMPGASQHQLGTVVDFGSITDEFAETKAGKWLTQNAHRYGFSLSFPDGYEKITGYRWESWHYRYIGTKAVCLQNNRFGGIQQYLLEFLYVWKKKS